MTDTRTLPSHDRHVHMSRVREHLRRVTKHAAIIHGREVVLHSDSSVPPIRPATPSSPRNPHSGGGVAGSTR